MTQVATVLARSCRKPHPRSRVKQRKMIEGRKEYQCATEEVLELGK